MTLAAGGLIDVGDIADTGWQPIDLTTGMTAVSGYTPEVRRQGIVVWTRGRANYGGAWSGVQLVGTLPPGFGFEPSNIIEGGPTMYGVSSNVGRLFCSPSGEISISGGSAIGTSDFYLSTLGWMTDL